MGGKKIKASEFIFLPPMFLPFFLGILIVMVVQSIKP